MRLKAANASAGNFSNLDKESPNRPFPSYPLRPFASVSKRVYVRNHSNENEFDLHENGHVFESHFHMNGFAPRLVLKQRQRVTRKWPI